MSLGWPVDGFVVNEMVNRFETGPENAHFIALYSIRSKSALSQNDGAAL